MQTLRPTAHTGANRCWPCTGVNLAIAAALSTLLVPFSAVLAVVAFAVSALVVAYVGYLVPGTPALTRRYLPDGVLAWFGKAPPEPAPARTDGAGSEVDRLLARDVLEEHDDGSLSLTPAFRERWDERVEALGDEAAQRASFAAMVGTDPDGVSFEEIDSTGATSVRLDNGPVSQWISGAALLADVAANEALSAVDPEWSDLPVEDRHGALVGLRQFREDCPACGGELVSRPEDAATCCWTRSAVTARCADCADRLYVVAEHPE